MATDLDSPKSSSSAADSECGEITSILDQDGDGRFLCSFVGFDRPFWVDHDGMFKDGVCTCPIVWDEYNAYLSSFLPLPSVSVSDRLQLSSDRSSRFEVSDDELKSHAMWLASKARSAPTAASYAMLWNQVVLKHCHWRKLDPFALTSSQIEDILGWHEMTGHAGEIERLFNAIRIVYVVRSKKLPDLSLAREIVKGAARVHAEEKDDVIREGFPIHRFKELCLRPHAYARVRTGTRDKCVMGLGLRAMKRPSELSKFKRRHLRWTLPSIQGWSSPDGAPGGFENRWLEVYVRDQKNDKKAHGQWIFIEPTWAPHCTCRLMVNYCTEFGVSLGPGPQGDLYLFHSLIDNRRPMSSAAVNSLVKKAAAMLDLEHVTGQSLRIGGATAAAAGGLDLSIIRAIGGWFGESVFRYIRAAAAPAQRVSARMGF